ncbi:hypothetical protein CEE69_12745 [Rhodopirellula bahusiensis]|uniref:Uncharacterized protein n=1 Tax=Rhodopirellula bahusiensis TaxID=2014065 RepID=A0A2G1W6V7_9BACT|nr:hypothetical protein CEE69_12745 [Rhodopirellula bahusiensis]
MSSVDGWMSVHGMTVDSYNDLTSTIASRVRSRTIGARSDLTCVDRRARRAGQPLSLYAHSIEIP